MEIIVFAKVFRQGMWNSWEYRCSPQDVEAVYESATAKAADRGQFGASPLPIDYLKAVHYLFDVTRGPEMAPREGDKLVYGVSVDNLLIGYLEGFRGERLIA